MKRLFALLLLLAVATCAQAADIVILFSPVGEQLPAGEYRLVTIPADARQAISDTRFVVGIGVAPPVVVPPTVDPLGVEAKISALFAGVSDPDKSKIAAKLAQAYTATAGFAAAGTITDAESLKTVQQKVDESILALSNKTNVWKPFTTGVAEIAKPLDFANTINTYKSVAKVLGGSPVVPPTVPPVTAASKAAILIESGDQNAKQATLLGQLRNDKNWSKKILILDPNQKLENGQPDPQVASLTQAISSKPDPRPLPRLVLLSSDGGYVDDKPLPETWDATKAELVANGVKQ